jgi:hypothetical protein
LKKNIPQALGFTDVFSHMRQGMTRKNQVGNWGRKNKLTQGASVNTPRHCGEMSIYFLRLLAARQAMEFFLNSRVRRCSTVVSHSAQSISLE